MATKASSSVEILLITHAGIGRTLLDNARQILGSMPCQCHCVDVALDQDPAATFERARQLIANAESVLVLTDLYGSTPANIACRVGAACKNNALVISGLNLAMLVKALANASLPLEQLAEKAAAGARKSILVEAPSQQ